MSILDDLKNISERISRKRAERADESGPSRIIIHAQTRTPEYNNPDKLHIVVDEHGPLMTDKYEVHRCQYKHIHKYEAADKYKYCPSCAWGGLDVAQTRYDIESILGPLSIDLDTGVFSNPRMYVRIIDRNDKQYYGADPLTTAHVYTGSSRKQIIEALQDALRAGLSG